MPDPRYVQLLNPRGWWVQIDRERGRIIGHRTDKWPGVPVAKPGVDLNRIKQSEREIERGETMDLREALDDLKREHFGADA